MQVVQSSKQFDDLVQHLPEFLPERKDHLQTILSLQVMLAWQYGMAWQTLLFLPLAISRCHFISVMKVHIFHQTYYQINEV